MSIYIKQINTETMMIELATPVWDILSDAYLNVKGGLTFESKEDLINNTCEWKVIFSGKNIVAITIYKAKRGLKLVAMATNKLFRTIGKQALIQLIKSEIKHCWMELSENAEHFVMKYCNGKSHRISKLLIPELLNKKVSLSSDDDFYYYRTINNVRKQKVVVGTPNSKT